MIKKNPIFALMHYLRMENILQRSTGLRRLLIYLPMLFLILCFNPNLFAQSDLNIHGVVSDAMSSSKLDAVKVTIKKDGQTIDSFTTRANGKYEFYLDAGGNYEIGFAKEGYIERFIIIDSRNVPEEVVGAGIIMPTDMSMFELTAAMEDVDVSVFSKPIGKAKYDPAQADLVWDFEYTSGVQSEINSLMRTIEQKQKDLDKLAKENAKAAEDLEKNFAKFVANGDNAKSKSNYEIAIENYKEALKLKPDEPSVAAKLAEVEKTLEELQAKEKLENEYIAALDQGDSFYRTEDFVKAIEQYKTALEIKPTEAYPKEQIAAAEKIIAEKEKNKALDEQFNQLLVEGDEAMSSTEYETALTKYQEALALKSSDSTAKNKVKSAQDAIANKEKQAEKEEQYAGFIAAADKLFNAANYAEAITEYTNALSLKSEEAYPKEKIAASEKNLADLAMAEENEKKFADLVAAADADIDAEKFSLGIDKYKEALQLKADDEPVKQKLADAEGFLQSKIEKEGLEKRYTELIAEAEAYSESNNYVSAIEKFTEASEAKPNETYPKEQITTLNDLLAEQEALEAKAQAEEEQRLAEEAKLASELEQYNSLISRGDDAYSSANFQEAIDRYKEALVLKPDNTEVSDKIADAEKALVEKNAAMAVDDQYNEIIARADSKMKEGILQDALSAYESALDLKSEEEYPASQIAIINGMIADKEADAQAEAERAEMEEQFNSLLADGDKQFEKEKYDRALEDYQEAKALIDNEIVNEKIEQAEAALYAISDAGQKEEQYNSLIAEADDLFKNEDYEMAKLKYMDATVVKPDEDYPEEQISEIDRLVEQMQTDAEAEALAEEEARRKAEEEKKRAGEEEIENMYSEAIGKADRLRDNEEYNRAIDAYNEALVIKPEEFYPQDQIEEITQKLDELDEAEKEKERLAELEREREAAARKKKETEFKQVSGNSEDQAEEFLRESRRAEDQERYERIKKLKEGLAETEENYRESAEETRSQNLEQYDSYRKSLNEQYADQYAMHENKIRNSQRNKELLMEQEQERSIENSEKAKADYADLMAENSALQDVYQQRNDERQANVEKIREQSIQYNEAVNKRNTEYKETIIQKGKEQQEYKANLQIEMFEKSSARMDNAKEVVEYRESYNNQQMKKSQEEVEKLRETSVEIQEQKQRIQETNSEISREIVDNNNKELEQTRKTQEVNHSKYAQQAERRRKNNREELSAVKSNEPKEYDEYFRTELAENYPQGVSEESSTQGNKVIITRVVVIGNKGDEYRKVLDKAGKYYFKNGQSISENTWNRETIEAFKD